MEMSLALTALRYMVQATAPLLVDRFSVPTTSPTRLPSVTLTFSRKASLVMLVELVVLSVVTSTERSSP